MGFEGIMFLRVNFPSLGHLSQLLHMGRASLKHDGQLIRSQLVSQLIHVQLVSLDFGPQGVINKIYNLLHHELG